MKTIKEVRDRLLKGKGNPGLDKVSDINVICSVLTGFLKSLREPVLTFRMHPVFVMAAGEMGGSKWKNGGQKGLEKKTWKKIGVGKGKLYVGGGSEGDNGRQV